ncbi:hypothetical protein PSHT_06178 [Puccinia striiformis]|uniref:Uncharacterized protein n=1 Tax=Puccinia striiformis TaxID=27350 RepID=A0A2S4W8N9_9BASI|nr:hypothetical protein PSHT_06178 [Puccinia striiformis]
MSTRSTGLPLLAPTDPEAIIRAANAERRRLEEAALDPIRTDSPTPSTPFRTPTESDSSSIEHLSSYLAPATHPNMSTGQPTKPSTATPPTDSGALAKSSGDALPPTPDKSATTDDHLNRFLQIQNAGALQMQEAIRNVLELQRIDRETAAEDRREAARRIALLEEALLRSSIKSEDDSKPSKVKSDWVDLLKLRFSDGPSYTGPPQAIEPFLQWITALQIFFDSKAISHPADKMIVAGGLLKTTALLSFYSNEGRTLPRRRGTNSRSASSKWHYRTRGRTLQAMINFDAASNLPDEALAEYIVLGLSVELRGKANEWELLEANPFKYPHFEKRLAAFDEILKEQAPPRSSRIAASPQSRALSLLQEGLWKPPRPLPSPNGQEVGRHPHLLRYSPKPADYKRPRAHDPAPNPAGRPIQPPAGRPVTRAATVAAVDETPVPDTPIEEFESFPPPAFEDAELSVIGERTIDTIDAARIHEEDHLTPEFCTNDLTQAVDWRELAAVQEEVSSYGSIDFGRNPFDQPPASLPSTADIKAGVAAFTAPGAADNATDTST